MHRLLTRHQRTLPHPTQTPFRPSARSSYASGQRVECMEGVGGEVIGGMMMGGGGNGQNCRVCVLVHEICVYHPHPLTMQRRGSRPPPPSCARPAPSPPAFPRKQLQHIGVGPMSTRHMKGLTYQCHACSCSVAKLVTVHAPLPLARRSAAEADAARGRRRRCP